MDDQSVNVSGSGNRVIAHSTNSRNASSGNLTEEATLINERIAIILAGVRQHEGSVTINYNADDEVWLVGVVFGQEAEDSDMAGGVSYGMGVSLAECLRMVVEETGWDR